MEMIDKLKEVEADIGVKLIRAFMLTFIIACLYFAVNHQELTIPRIIYPNGTTISGSCDFIYNWSQKIRTGNDYITIVLVNITPKLVNMTIDNVNRNSLCNYQDPSLETIGGGTDTSTYTIKYLDKPCTPQIAMNYSGLPTVCPSLAIPNELAKKALNVRLPGAAPCAQDGCIKCLRETWDLLQIPGRPKFNPGPSNNALGYYNSLVTHKEEANTFCFIRDYGYNYQMGGQGFFLNASMWRWNNTPQSWDVLNISYYDNGTEHKRWIDTYSNASDNIWVQER